MRYSTGKYRVYTEEWRGFKSQQEIYFLLTFETAPFFCVYPVLLRTITFGLVHCKFQKGQNIWVKNITAIYAYASTVVHSAYNSHSYDKLLDR